MAATYRIVVKDGSGNTIGEFDRFKSLRFRHVLNRDGDCSFTLSLKDMKVTGEFIVLGKREVYVYRNTDIVWGGVIVNYSGFLDGGDSELTIYAKGFFWLFRKRHTGASRVFSNTDAGQIAWTLINESQQLTNGNFGITQGTIASSVNRDRTYEYKNIYDALVQLSDVKNGFDFQITQTKVFNVYYPKGSDKSGSVILSWGKNIYRLGFTVDFADPINQAIVLGGGFGQAMKVATRDDTALQSAYGLRQETVPYKDVEEQALLEAKGDIEIIQRGQPRKEYRIVQTPEIEPVFTSLEVGDWIRVEAEYGSFISLFDVVRIATIEVDFTDGVELVHYTFLYD